MLKDNIRDYLFTVDMVEDLPKLQGETTAYFVLGEYGSAVLFSKIYWEGEPVDFDGYTITATVKEGKRDTLTTELPVEIVEDNLVKVVLPANLVDVVGDNQICFRLYKYGRVTVSVPYNYRVVRSLEEGVAGDEAEESLLAKLIKQVRDILDAVSGGTGEAGGILDQLQAIRQDVNELLTNKDVVDGQITDLDTRLTDLDGILTVLENTLADELAKIHEQFGYHENMLSDLDVAMMREVGKLYTEMVDMGDNLTSQIGGKADVGMSYTKDETNEQLDLQNTRDKDQEDAITALYINELAQNKTILELVEKVDDLIAGGGSPGEGGTVDLTEVINARVAMDGQDKGSLSARLEHDYLTLDAKIDSEVRDLGDLIDANTTEIGKKFDKTGGTVNGAITSSGNIHGYSLSTSGGITGTNISSSNKQIINTDANGVYIGNPTIPVNLDSSVNPKITIDYNGAGETAGRRYDILSTYNGYTKTQTDGFLNNKANTSHTHTAVDLPTGSTSQAGLVRLYNGVDSSSTSTALTSAQGKVLKDMIDNLSGGGSATTVVDNLTSSSATSALSANQGRVLNEKFAGYSLTSHTHSGYATTAHTHTTYDNTTTEVNNARTDTDGVVFASLKARIDDDVNWMDNNKLNKTGGEITGDLDVQGDLDFDNGLCHGKLEPAVNISYNLGASDKRWSNVYGFHGDFTGNLSAGATTLDNATVNGALSSTSLAVSGDVHINRRLFADSAYTTNKTIFQCSASSPYMYFGNSQNAVMIETLDGKAYVNSTSNEILTTGTSSKTWKGTRAEYDAITTKDPDTLYFVKK